MKDRSLKGRAALEALESEGRLFASPAEAAAVLERDHRTVRLAMARGEVPYTRVGNRFSISVHWLRRTAEGRAAA